MFQRILVVEDDENKKLQLIQFLKATWPGIEIEAATSFHAGLRALKESGFTFVLLDMTLPTYEVGPEEDGGELRQRGGQDFLRRMKRAGIETPTVIVTQYETFGSGRDRVDLSGLRCELERQFGEFCYGVVYYNSALDSWKQELTELINKVHKD